MLSPTQQIIMHLKRWTSKHGKLKKTSCFLLAYPMHLQLSVASKKGLITVLRLYIVGSQQLNTLIKGIEGLKHARRLRDRSAIVENVAFPFGFPNSPVR